MSLQRVRPATRTRTTALLELVQAITGDRDVERAWHSLRAGDRDAAVMRAIQRVFGGSAVRLYVPARTTDPDELARRAQALAQAPACMTPSQIARELGITPRHARRLLKRAASG